MEPLPFCIFGIEVLSNSSSDAELILHYVAYMRPFWGFLIQLVLLIGLIYVLFLIVRALKGWMF